jgi:carboxylate-amine ligase
MQDFTLGVEEEYQIINPETRALRSRAQRVLKAAQQTLGDEVQPELHQSQIETATPICQTLSEVRAELARLRGEIIAAAQAGGDTIAAAGTHPFSHWEEQRITPKPRYQGLVHDFQQLAREQVIFGCHVHVGLADPEDGVAVINRARVWLAPILALAANSPFWQGDDTGYASFRTELWGRWPMAGPPQLFADRAEYDRLIGALVATGSIEDVTKVYWDIRLPEKVPTVEFRIADVCQTIDEAVMVAGLARALARTCREQARRNEPFPAARPELLRAAHWRAARFGLDADLIDPYGERAVPAADLVEALLAFVRPSLEEFDDWDEVSALVRDTLGRGNGATRQRRAFERAGRMEDVVDAIVAETARGVA